MWSYLPFSLYRQMVIWIQKMPYVSKSTKDNLIDFFIYHNLFLNMIQSIFLKSYFSQMKTLLSTAIITAFNPKELSVVDESKNHSRGKETHFNVTIVSDRFQGLTKIQKHKLVYEELAEIIPKIHAITLTCKSI